MGDWYITFKTRGGGFGYSGPFLTRWGARRVAKKWKRHGSKSVRVVPRSELLPKEN